MKKPATVPIRLSRRRSFAIPSPSTKESADEAKAKAPKRPSIQAPMDIGSQNLNFMSMFRKRLGVPRSRMRRRPQTETRSSASTSPTRNTLLSLRLPKLSAMAAVKYAPPAIPPRKKYQTMSRCQSGDLSMAAVLGVAAIGSAPLAEREERPDADEERRPDGQQRVHDHVALGKGRLLRQRVGRRLVEQEEERVETAQRAIAVGAVELRVFVAHALERRHALVGLGHQLVPEAELDGLRGAGLRAGGAEAVVDAIIAERALVGPPRIVIEGDHAEGAGADAVAATVADILIDIDRPVLRPVDRARRAGVETAGLRAVLADVGHQEPGELAVGLGLLDEADEAIGLVRERGVVLVRARPFRLLAGQLVP